MPCKQAPLRLEFQVDFGTDHTAWAFGDVKVEGLRKNPFFTGICTAVPCSAIPGTRDWVYADRIDASSAREVKHVARRRTTAGIR